MSLCQYKNKFNSFDIHFKPVFHPAINGSNYFDPIVNELCDLKEIALMEYEFRFIIIMKNWGGGLGLSLCF